MLGGIINREITEYTHSMLSVTGIFLSESNKPSLRDKELYSRIFGYSGTGKYAIDLANHHISTGKPVDATVINAILNTNITETKLQELLNSPRLIFNNITNSSNVIKIVIRKGNAQLGTSNWLAPKGARPYNISGIYRWTYLPTNQQYVGSSIQLPIRLRSYFAHSMRLNGKFLPLFYTKPLAEFSLEVIFVENGHKYELVLEQFYLLRPSDSDLNTIRVSNNPSGSVTKALYMYNRDCSIIYYFSNKQTDFVRTLNVSHTTFNKYLDNNKFYLNKYVFSREFYNEAVFLNMPLEELTRMLENDRIRRRYNQELAPHSKPVTIQQVNTQKVLEFGSLGLCVKFLKSEGHKADQRTLVKRLDTNQPYYNYVCRTVKVD